MINDSDELWTGRNGRFSDSRLIFLAVVSAAVIIFTLREAKCLQRPLSPKVGGDGGKSILPGTTSRKRDPPRALFVFFAGLEGTGHHFYEKIMQTKAKKLQQMTSYNGTNFVADILSIELALYNDAVPERGLFTGPLAFKKKRVHPDGDALFQTVVDLLNATHHRVLDGLEKMSSEGNSETVPIPLNAFNVRGPFGMNSYPNYLVPLRPLQYPDLHLLYRACDAAQVDCGHVYMHRDPYEIIGTSAGVAPTAREQ